ncbi:staphylolytic protease PREPROENZYME LASA [Aliigemmobacter aestuarii]|uniref:Staphylolytic protease PREPROENZYME LASA n=2 Tax=Aliigemmobacter aestuarii TaxID=1445661 RepID=A0A4S3MLK9_9RHOB|nr:staphylolytic protease PREPROENZYME LASA [Gemmobacter aestuarii]
MENTLVPFELVEVEIAALAKRYRRANGPVMAILNRFGGQIEGQMRKLPEPLREASEGLVVRALEQGFDLAGAAGGRLPDAGRQAPLAVVMAAGAAGGAGGLATSLAELPVTVTVILHALRREAVAAGFDPDAPDIRAEILNVFASGSPLAEDDGVNTAFLGARLSVTGPALNKLIQTLAPRIAAILGQKLAAQAVPVLGAAAGATLNAAFLAYYREMAGIRFGLLRLAAAHGDGPVLAAFRKAAASRPLTRAR